MRGRVMLVWAAAGAASLAGCGAAPGPFAQYPGAKRIDRVVDAQVLREETEIVLTNTTAAALPPGRLWLNNWYSREFEGLAIGETVTLGLSGFRDEFGGGFRAGGFFATRAAEPVVAAQVEPADGSPLIALLVIREKAR